MVRERTGVAQDVAIDIAHTADVDDLSVRAAVQSTTARSRNAAMPRPAAGRSRRPPTAGSPSGSGANQFVPTQCEGARSAPELATDPRFATDAGARKEKLTRPSSAEVHRGAVARSARAAEVVEHTASQRRVVAACCFRPSQLGLVNRASQGPRFLADVLQTAKDGPKLALGPQFRMSRTPRQTPTGAPALGGGGNE